MNQPYGQLPTGPRNSTLAIISLIGGITGWTVLPFLGAIVAVITGHMAQSEIKKSGGMITGKGMATAGLIMGYIVLAGGLCAACVAVALPLLALVGISIPMLTIPLIGNVAY
jgi:hypothetical protein